MSKSDYVVTVHIKQHPHISHKLMRARLDHYLNYWLHGDATFNILRIVRKPATAKEQK